MSTELLGLVMQNNKSKLDPAKRKQKQTNWVLDLNRQNKQTQSSY